MEADDMKRLAHLGFEDFRAMALDPKLNKYQKIGAHEAFRRDQEDAIFADILGKLPTLHERGRRVIDIGPGCSDLPQMLMRTCAAQGHELFLVDSAEMLSLLPDGVGVHKVAARFPDCDALLRQHAAGFDVVLVYSVFHYVFQEGNAWDFFDRALSLLAPGGAMLLGDLPNVSKRRRFFSSEAGVKFHQAFMQTQEPPVVDFNRLEPGRIDDSVVLSLLMRARAQGFDAYVVPQSAGLPMANRREDMLVVRP